MTFPRACDSPAVEYALRAAAAYIRKLGLRWADAEDALCEARLGVLRALPRARQDGFPKAYLAATAVGVVKQWRQRRLPHIRIPSWRQARGELPPEVLTWDFDMPDMPDMRDPHGEDELHELDMRMLVQALSQELSAHQRQILQSLIAEEDPGQLAERMGWEKHHAQNEQSRIRRIMRGLLEET